MNNVDVVIDLDNDSYTEMMDKIFRIRNLRSIKGFVIYEVKGEGVPKSREAIEGMITI